MTQTIAERFIERYDSEDFKSDYKMLLSESFGNNKGDIINRIIDLFNVSNYETNKQLSNHKTIDREQAKKIYAFINENIDEFITNFRGYFVGYTSLDSVEFGEQEEELTSIRNHKGGKPGRIYEISYLRKAFRAAGYTINTSNPNYAYYIVDGGLHVNLLNQPEKLNAFLATI